MLLDISILHVVKRYQNTVLINLFENIAKIWNSTLAKL